MEHKIRTCPVCGSANPTEVEKRTVGSETYYVYKCHACGEEFDTEQYKTTPTHVDKGTEAVAQGNDLAVEIYNKCIKYMRSVVADFKNNRSAGTAISLGGGYYVTNCHVVTNTDDNGKISIPDEIALFDDDGKGKYAELIAAEPTQDIAIVKSTDYCGGATFFDGEVRTGEKIFAIGNSKGQGLNILDGIVSDRNRQVGAKECIMFSAPIVGGNSGGALLNVRGEVIGITTSGLKDTTAMNYAIVVSTIKAFVDAVNDKEELQITLITRK